MMEILKYLFFILIYLVIGKLFINIYCAIQEDLLYDKDTQNVMAFIWPVVAIFEFLHLFWTLISFIGNRLSVIPIALIKLIQITIKRKSKSQESEVQE